MKDIRYRKIWDLDTLFPGGSESHQLSKHIEGLVGMVSEFKSKADCFHTPQDVGDSIKVAELIDYISTITTHLSEANSFTTCLLAQNPKDQKASSLQGQIESVRASFESVVQKTQSTLVNTERNLWEALLDTDVLCNYEFKLNEWREKGQLQLPDNEEKLVTDLMVDGYHAWRSLYNALMGDIIVHVPINGKISELSMGQAMNLRSHPNVEVRKESHKALEDVWMQKEELVAKVLNHIAGFRLQVHKHKGIENVLKEPLLDNHMQEETLNAMWRAVSKYKEPFIGYLNKKAEILGEPRLNSYNFWAPITESKQQMNYNEAINFVIEHLGRFGPEMEKFSRQAFEKGWVESEDRPNKSAIPFCAGFPLSGQSRVFMTYGGTIKDVLTIVHELGHAFHNDAMKSVEGINKQYPLSIAETASTFSEMVMLDAAIEKTSSNKERLLLLDEKLKRSVMNFMNIHSRFLFEKNFYEERKEGIVSSSRLNELMQEAINEGYKGSIDTIPIRSWVWTPHYYITKSPFYNFPYTFGYLFALSIYEKAKVEGKKFETKYLAILRDSGSMTVEDLVMKHLREDITSEAFWEKGLKMCIGDAEEFIQLSEYDELN
ncbi:M3 family oligoendopeptidase [Virgibacillus ihumii]|uniref:M3 family oligoendopeptidase n=1 Tax=Virgibacillus ihumii TaxID=2686091 RepID=UPI00157D4160|nr:M3 family oligoendopeptidase [Virgibacillus ihumii]